MLLSKGFFVLNFLILHFKYMDIIHKRFPVEEISIDELREKEDDENESSFFERRLGLFCEMDTDSIGIKIALSRLFKKGVFSASEK